jgi:hypothetical protein
VRRLPRGTGCLWGSSICGLVETRIQSPGTVAGAESARQPHALTTAVAPRAERARPSRSLESWTPPTPGGRQAGWVWTVWSRHRSRASARTPFAPLESEPSRGAAQTGSGYPLFSLKALMTSSTSVASTSPPSLNSLMASSTSSPWMPGSPLVSNCWTGSC